MTAPSWHAICRTPFIDEYPAKIFSAALATAIQTVSKLAISVMQVQSQKAEIFQVDKRHIQNQKMIDKWGNARLHIALIINESIMY